MRNKEQTINLMQKKEDSVFSNNCLRSDACFIVGYLWALTHTDQLFLDVLYKIEFVIYNTGLPYLLNTEESFYAPIK